MAGFRQHKRQSSFVHRDKMQLSASPASPRLRCHPESRNEAKDLSLFNGCSFHIAGKKLLRNGRHRFSHSLIPVVDQASSDPRKFFLLGTISHFATRPAVAETLVPEFNRIIGSITTSTSVTVNRVFTWDRLLACHGIINGLRRLFDKLEAYPTKHQEARVDTLASRASL